VSCKIFENIVFIPRTHKYTVTNIFYSIFPTKTMGDRSHISYPNQHKVAHTVQWSTYKTTEKKMGMLLQ